MSTTFKSAQIVENTSHDKEIKLDRIQQDSELLVRKYGFWGFIKFPLFPVGMVFLSAGIWLLLTKEGGLDARKFLAFFNFEPTTDTVINHMLVFGHGFATAFVIAILALIGKHKQAQNVFWAILITMAIVYALKYGVGRERPSGKNTMSFPSADTAAAFVTLAPFFMMKRLTLPALILGLVVMFGRVWHQYHYPSDTCMGAAIALLVYCAVAQFSHKLPAIKNIKFWRIFLVAATLATAGLAFKTKKAALVIVTAAPAAIITLIIHFKYYNTLFKSRNINKFEAQQSSNNPDFISDYVTAENNEN